MPFDLSPKRKLPPFFSWPGFGYLIIAILLGVLVAELARRWNYGPNPIPNIGMFQ